MWLTVAKVCRLIVMLGFSWVIVFGLIGVKQAYSDNKTKDVTCHKGPHRISIAVSVPCEKSPSCILKKGPDEVYRELCITYANECFVIKEESYTDYPECDGYPTVTDLEKLCANEKDPMLCLLNELDRIEREI